MFRFLKKILHRPGGETGTEGYGSAEDFSGQEAAAAPVARSPQTPKSQNIGQNKNGKTVEVPLQPVLAGMPLELQSRIRQTDVGDLALIVPLEKILAQLSQGVVRLPYGDLRRAFPSVFTKESDLDKVLVPLPLNEVLSRINPALIRRRRTQRQVEVPAEISSPFEEQYGLGGNGGGYEATPAEEPAEPLAEESFVSETPEEPAAEDEVPAEPFARQTAPPSSKGVPHGRSNLVSAPTPPPPSAAPPVMPTVPPSRSLRDFHGPGGPQRQGHGTEPPIRPVPPPVKQGHTQPPIKPVAPQVPGKGGTQPPFKPAPPISMRQGHTQPPIKPVAPQVPGKGGTQPPFKPAPPISMRQGHTQPPLRPGAPQPPRTGNTTQFKGAPAIRPVAPKPAPPVQKAPPAEPIQPLKVVEPAQPPVPPQTRPVAPASVPAPASAAGPQAQPARAPKSPPIVTTLVALAEAWPDNVRKEIVQSGLVDASVHLPAELIERGLKQGRVGFTWRIVRSWIQPPPSGTSSSEGTMLELPLKVVAPLFLARQQEAAKARAPKVEVDEDIPNLFFGFPQPDAAAAAAATATPADTNFYVWDDTADGVKVAESDLKRGPSAGTRFVSKYATPNEIVSRTAAVEGVAGALVALPDGLLVASQLPSDLNADTLAAFLPQIFGKVAQCTKELRMGELNNLNFTVGNVPWKIFRVNAIFFAAFGRAGEPLPTAKLAALAGELDHKPK